MWPKIPMANAVTETKAQRVERLKREKNPWEGLDDIRKFAREGFDSITARMAGHILPLVGRVHAGRRRRRDRRQERRRQGAAVLHGAHPHSQRPAPFSPASNHRQRHREIRPRNRRPDGPPEHSAALGDDPRPARVARRIVARRPDHHGLLRRRYPQHHRLPARRRRCRRNLRCLVAGARSQPLLRGQRRFLQPAAQVQSLHHRMPRLVRLSGDQRCWLDRDSPRGRIPKLASPCAWAAGFRPIRISRFG